tara:strand:- start:824 stop:1012 length:189 start_codon:yes stop_codon:yes gene_type:complete
MMDLVVVHEEVLRFLDESEAVFLFENGKKGFYVNEILHIEGDEPGVYIRQFTDIKTGKNDIN